LVASRKDRSSSTIDIIGTFDKAAFLPASATLLTES
jgi:hypothetical protein